MNREIHKPDHKHPAWLAQAVTLIILACLALFIAFGSMTFGDVAQSEMYESRFGVCDEYRCNNISKLAIVIPFQMGKSEELILFLKKIFVDSDKTHFPEIDLLLFAYDQALPNDKWDSLTEKVKSLKIAQLFGRTEMRFAPERFESEDAFLRFLLLNQTVMQSYCYFQYMSMNIRILRSDWISRLIEYSLNASSHNFWIKGGIDMSYKRHAKYEDLYLTPYSLYATRCMCLRDLIVYAEEEHSEWPIQKSINEMMRSPSSSVGFAHMLATKIIPSPMSINFENTEIAFSEAKYRFADALWIQGTRISNL